MPDRGEAREEGVTGQRRVVMTLYQGGRGDVPRVGSVPELASEALSPEAVVSHQLLPHPVPLVSGAAPPAE